MSAQYPQKQRRSGKAGLSHGISGPLHPPNRPRPQQVDASSESTAFSSSSSPKKRSLSSANHNHNHLHSHLHTNSYPRQSSYSLSSTATNSQPSQGQFSNQTHQEQQHEQPAPPGSLFTAQQRLHAQAMAAEQAQNRAAQQEQMDHPNKRRRGIGSAIVDTALSAAVTAGAAAITAYTLWSSWGNRSASSQENQQGENSDQGQGSRKSGNEKSSLEEPPPPPYQYPADPKSPSAPLSPSSASSPRHIYVSRRRRRPAFQSAKSARTIAAERERAKSRNNNFGSPSTTSSALEADETTNANGEEEEEEEDDEDETFSRFQAKMSSLIAEGQAALTSTADMEGVEDDEEEERFKKMHSSMGFSSRSNDVGNSIARYENDHGYSNGNLFGFNSSSLNQPSPSNRFFTDPSSSSSNPHFHSSISNFNPGLDPNPFDPSSIPPEPSKTSQFASHTPPHGAGQGGYDFNFRPRIGAPSSAFAETGPFSSPNQAFNSFTPASPSPLARQEPAAPFVFGASNPSAGQARNSSSSPYARRAQNGKGPRMRTQPRWVG